MRVYRIEKRDGTGPFDGSISNVRAEAERRFGWGRVMRWTNPYEMPGPGRDGEEPHRAALREHGSGIIFGWKNKAQMRRWFRPYMCRELRARGFHLSEYEVPSATFTDSQATFLKAGAKLVKVHPLT